MYKLVLFIIDYFKKLVSDTQAAIDEPNAEDSVSILLKIWCLRVFLPAGLIVGAISLIKVYFIYIAMAVFGISILYFDKKEKEAEQNALSIIKLRAGYSFVGWFIFHPLVELSAYLPVQKPQDIHSIAHNPDIIDYGTFNTYVYRLLKSNPEPISEDKLAFAEKIFSSLLTTELNRYESEHQDGDTYAEQLRRIELDKIEDVGSCLLVHVAYVDNRPLHDYIQNKRTPQPLKPSSGTPYDEDF